jgi:Zn finger protein HypA/HybF involved in hydrogenase expression
MKAAKVVEVAEVPFKIWCERCSIRIAPNEQRIAVRDKTYHVNCHSKLVAVSKVKI